MTPYILLLPTYLAGLNHLIFLNIINVYTKRERSTDVDKNIRGESRGGPINCTVTKRIKHIIVKPLQHVV